MKTNRGPILFLVRETEIKSAKTRVHFKKLSNIASYSCPPNRIYFNENCHCVRQIHALGSDPNRVKLFPC